jgi:hypothetical protein
MTFNTWKPRVLARTAAIASMTVVLLAATSIGAAAQSSGSDGPGLVGTWMVQVTLRDCATNAPLGQPFHSLVTFHAHGTISESAGSLSFAPGQRSPGHGVWTRERAHTFGQDMIALILFDTAPNLPGTPAFDPTKPVSPGFFAGWATVSHTVRLTDTNHIESSGTNAFYRTNGEVYRSGCSTATGHRF